MCGKILYVLLGAIIGSQAIPKVENPCTRGDVPCFAKIANDFYQVAIKGDAALNLESLDPLYEDLIEGNLDVLKYKLHNSTLVGFKNCIILNTRLEDDDSEMEFRFSCPLLEMEGRYETKGKVLGLPVEGKGDYTLEAKDYSTFVITQLKKTKGNDGKEYLSFKNFQTDGSLKGGSFHLSDLFNGHKDLSDTFHKFVNENWVEVAKEMQGPVFTATVKRVLKSLNKIFKSVPIDQILKEP